MLIPPLAPTDGGPASAAGRGASRPASTRMLSRIVVTFAGDAEPRPLPPARRRTTGDGGPVGNPVR